MTTVVILDGPAKSTVRMRIKAADIFRMVRVGIRLNGTLYRATGLPVSRVLVLREV